MSETKKRDVRAELVAIVEEAADDKEASAADSRGWRWYNEEEAKNLRALADELRALPDDDARLRELDGRLRGGELPWGDLSYELNPPGIHPDADPPTPGVDELLEWLLDHLEDEDDEQATTST